MFGFVGLILFWLLYPYRPISFNYDKAEVITPVVKRSETMQFKASYCRHNDMVATISRQLINTYIYYYSDITSASPKGCQDRIISVDIPVNIEPGEYYVKNTYSYKVNPIRTIKFVKETEKFEII